MAIYYKTIRQFLFLVMSLMVLTSCNLSDDEVPTDRKETITLYVSSEIGYMTGLCGSTHECMLIKEKGSPSWKTWEFGGIVGFSFEKGYEYELLVTKTTYANPPADGYGCSYELIRIFSKNLAQK